MNYYYKLKDMEDDRYSYYIVTDTKCDDLIDDICGNYIADEECEINGKVYCEENFLQYIYVVLKDNGIKVEQIRFKQFLW